MVVILGSGDLSGATTATHNSYVGCQTTMCVGNEDRSPVRIIAERQSELQPALPRWSARSIVRFDRAFDNLGFLSNKFRQTLFYIVRGQVH